MYIHIRPIRSLDVHSHQTDQELVESFVHVLHGLRCRQKMTGGCPEKKQSDRAMHKAGNGPGSVAIVGEDSGGEGAMVGSNAHGTS